MDMHMHTRMHAHTHKHTSKQPHKRTHKLERSHLHKHKIQKQYTHMHTSTHTHTHTSIYKNKLSRTYATYCPVKVLARWIHTESGAAAATAVRVVDADSAGGTETASAVFHTPSHVNTSEVCQVSKSQMRQTFGQGADTPIRLRSRTLPVGGRPFTTMTLLTLFALDR
jgi:hypothetical protein